MTEPVQMSLDDLRALPGDSTELWALSSLRPKLREELQYRFGKPAKPAAGTDRVIAVGGGKLLDAAKAWRADHSPATRLIAVPSIWGSGAEVSPVVVAEINGKKSIRMDDRFLPDYVVYWPELAEDIPDARALTACGDCWSHALEGFLSPLANAALRKDIAALMGRMLDVPLGKDPDWFRLSSEACAAQARSSVGLVHGIAHTLEGVLSRAQPESDWGHAKLCSTFLAPVLAFNGQDDGKSIRLMEEYGVETGRVMEVVGRLHDSEAYRAALPLLIENWRTVLRDQCSRTNVRLVRPGDIGFFEAWSLD